MDDPYITLHSAQVLHWGFDPNYVGVAALYGVTSAPFLALVYLLLFVLSPLQALDAACWLGVLFYTFGLVRLTRTFSLSRVDSSLLVALGLFASFVPFHLVNGLETSWALGCVIWTLGLASGNRRQWIWCAACAGLTVSVRPDMAPFAGLVIGALAFQIRQTDGTHKALLQFLRFSAAGLLPILVCAWWYYHATGVPFPQTGMAKRYFFADDGLPWLMKMKTEGGWSAAFLVTCGPLVLVLARMARNTVGKTMLLFFVLFFAAVYVQFPDAVSWNWFRYTVVLVPVLVWGLALPVSARAESQERTPRLLYACAVYSILFLPICISAYRHKLDYYDSGMRQTAAWCEQHLPSDARLMVEDAGYIAYGTHLRIIDFVGLKTPEAIPLNRRYTWPSSGSQRAVAISEIGRQTGAEYLVTLQLWPPMIALPGELRALGWRVDPLRTEGMYWVYRLTAPAK